MELAKIDKKIFLAEAKESDWIILPIGSTEQHGSHLPYGTDMFIADEISSRVAENISCLTLPSLPYGVSWINKNYPGTITISYRIFIDFTKEICKEAFRNGFKYISIINGHGGNSPALKIVARELNDEKVPIKILVFSYPKLEQIFKKYCSSEFISASLIHADELETSMMLAISADLCHIEGVKPFYPELEKFQEYILDLAWNEINPEGYFGDPSRSTKEKGDLILESFANEITCVIQSFQRKCIKNK